MAGDAQAGGARPSLVGQGRSHPSIQHAVDLAGATFVEVQGLAAFEQAIQEGAWRMLAITPLVTLHATHPCG